jgi:hypothetical protein
MKYLLLLSLLLSACATVSEYKQGCIDSLSDKCCKQQAQPPEDMVEVYCTNLEAKREVRKSCLKTEDSSDMDSESHSLPLKSKK